MYSLINGIFVSTDNKYCLLPLAVPQSSTTAPPQFLAIITDYNQTSGPNITLLNTNPTGYGVLFLPMLPGFHTPTGLQQYSNFPSNYANNLFTASKNK